MLGILAKLVYILTLGLFDVESLDHLGNGGRLGNGGGRRAGKNLPGNEKNGFLDSGNLCSSILERLQKFAPEVTPEKNLKPSLQGQTGAENFPSFSTSPGNKLSAINHTERETRQERRGNQGEEAIALLLLFMLMSEKARKMSLPQLACSGGLYGMVVSVPGLILSALFYMKSTDEQLGNIFLWATWGFSIAVGSSVAFCIFPTETRAFREPLLTFVVVLFIVLCLIHVVSMAVGIVDLIQGSILAAYYWWTSTQIDQDSLQTPPQTLEGPKNPIPAAVVEKAEGA